MLLTGPNASGKTVYLRTMALVTYLAHVGSFVPAEAALVGLTDGIYTRMHSKESAAIKSARSVSLAGPRVGCEFGVIIRTKPPVRTPHTPRNAFPVSETTIERRRTFQAYRA